MLATEPMIVRLPANVCRQREHFPHQRRVRQIWDPFPATRTKGTLEKTFEPATENQLKFRACSGAVVPKIGDDKSHQASPSRSAPRLRPTALHKRETGANRQA